MLNHICILEHSVDILAILNEQDKAELGLCIIPFYHRTTSAEATWVNEQPNNVSARDWLLPRLRKVKPFALNSRLYVDPLGKYVWFNLAANRIEAFLKATADPAPDGAPSAPTPVPWFQTPNGKRYLDEWRSGRLQHGAYVFADAGGTVRLLDPTKPRRPGDPVFGDVLYYIHSPCALIVQVDPGLLRAPSGIADVVATTGD
jgi:hypothetical protein